MSARRFEDMFRPAGEGWSVFGWASSVLTLLIARPPLWPILMLIPIALMVTRINDVKK
jgi:hypothetical protein